MANKPPWDHVDDIVKALDYTNQVKLRQLVEDQLKARAAKEARERGGDQVNVNEYMQQVMQAQMNSAGGGGGAGFIGLSAIEAQRQRAAQAAKEQLTAELNRAAKTRRKKLLLLDPTIQ